MFLYTCRRDERELTEVIKVKLQYTRCRCNEEVSQSVWKAEQPTVNY